MSQEKIKQKAFVWYGLRVSFWIMVGIWGLEILIAPGSFAGGLQIAVIWAISIIFTFVVSIIHLVKYKKKGLAITALVISSIAFLIMFAGFLSV